MEREIKYRGKDADGNWHYGVPIKTHIGTYIVEEENPHVCSMYGYMEIDEFSLVGKDTIGEFSIHKDKNSQEIYEGDILKTPMGNVGIIKFGTHEDIVHTREAARQGYNADCFECTGWLFENIKTKEIVFMDSSIISGEVIGNIYDNPELLNN